MGGIAESTVGFEVQHSEAMRSTGELRSGGARRSRVISVVALCALAFVVRICLWAAPPPELLPDAAGAWEELHRGTTAREFLDGPLLEPIDYQINGNWGGSLVVSLLAVPLYALFGSKLLVLRLTTLPFTALALASLFVLLERFHGRRAAWVGGLLLALAPPGYALLSAQAWGTHVESHAVALFLAALVLRRAPTRRSTARELLVGALMGFAVYFALALALAVAVLVGYELALARPDRRAMFARAGGFLLGALPLAGLAQELGPRGLALDSVVPILGLGEPGHPLRSLGHLVWHDAPRACFFAGGESLPGLWLGRAYVLFLLLAAGASIVRARRTLAAPWSRAASGGEPDRVLLGFATLLLAGFTLFYAIAGYDSLAHGELFRLRYALWPLPWTIVLAAPLLAGSSSARGRRARATPVPAVVVACLCGLATIGRTERAHAGDLAAAPGHSPPALGRFVVDRTREPGEMTRALERLLARSDASERAVILESMGRHLLALERLATSADPSARAILEASRRARAELEAALPPELLAVAFPQGERRVPGGPKSRGEESR